MYVVQGVRHDQGSIWYLEKWYEILIYPKYVVQGTKHNWDSI